MVWPGTSDPGATAFERAIASTIGRGSAEGEMPRAIDHNVSPKRTT